MTIRVIDLFSGAGGLTFGFQKKIVNNKFVGKDVFDIVFANEFDHNAAEAFRKNYPNVPMIEEDISLIDRDYLARKNIDISNIDLVIGGPPCQSFSTVGKRQYDNRAKMYQEYRRILSISQPKVFIFENVLGLLTMKNDNGNNVIEDVKASFENMDDFTNAVGYNIETKILNSKDFGVPQNRERVFIVGIRKDLDIKEKWRFPVELEGSPLTIKDAISDLPELNNAETKEKYNLEPQTKYQKLMRGDQHKLLNHTSGNHGERLQKIINAVKEGEGKEDINRLVKQGKLDQECFLTSGYSNTYGRLWWEKPSTTITNNLSSPSSLRCIHPKQNRALTPREGARLQSFPDNFKFIGAKHNINTQIGNAVPPLLSIHLADAMQNFLSNNFI